VYATATEDMDALTFRTPKLLRRFTSSQGKEKQPIIEVDFAVMLTGKNAQNDSSPKTILHPKRFFTKSTIELVSSW
jgi:hypothetical protein